MSLRVRAPATTANLGPGFDCAGGRARPLERGRGHRGGRAPAGPGAHRHPRVRADRLAGGALVRVDRAGSRARRGSGRARRRSRSGWSRRRSGRSRSCPLEELLARGGAARGPLGQPRRLSRRRRLPHLGGPDRASSPRRCRSPRSPSSRPSGCGRPRRGSSLPSEVPHRDAAFNVARAALLGAGLARGDSSLLAAAFADRLHEPYRPSAVLTSVRADLPAGAAGATLSGSGPTVIVWASDPETCAHELEERFPDAQVMVLAVAGAAHAVG